MVAARDFPSEDEKTPMSQGVIKKTHITPQNKQKMSLNKTEHLN